MSGIPQGARLSAAVMQVREWVFENELADDLTEFTEAFFEDIMEEGLLADAVAKGGESILSQMEFACFESFLSFRFEDDESVVDLYLEHAGQSLDEDQRAYLLALRDSRMSLFEVTDVVPKSHVVVQNLLASSDPIIVRETTASQSIRQWENLAARVVMLKGQPAFTGVILALSADSRNEILNQFDATLKEHLKQVPKSLRKDPATVLEVRDQLQVALPALVAGCWLYDQIDEPTKLTLRNESGDDICFVTLSYPVLGEPIGIRAKLDAADAIHPGADDRWIWVTDPEKIVLASFYLTESRLEVEVNSLARADMADDRVRALLGPRIGKPTRTEQTPEERRALYPEPEESAGLPSLEEQEEIRTVVKATLDAHFRKIIDTPLPFLNDRTLRQLSKSKAGRAKVVDWLKEAEKHSSSPGIQPEIRDYDYTWMWKELGVLDLRK